MSLEDLSRRTGESVEQRRHLQVLGLIGGDDELGSDSERVRLIPFARRRGIAPDDSAEVSRHQGDVLATFIDLLMQTTGKRESQPRDDALATLEVDPVFAARAWNAAGMAGQTELFEADVEALHWMEQARAPQTCRVRKQVAPSP